MLFLVLFQLTLFRGTGGLYISIGIEPKLGPTWGLSERSVELIS